MTDMISQGELHALREAAERAWDEDTRIDHHNGNPNPAVGQCFVTSAWLRKRFGGHVARVKGHYIWLSPDKNYVIDLTGDFTAYAPHPPHHEGAKLDEYDEDGVKYDDHHRKARPGPIMYKRADHPIYRGLKVVDKPDTPRAKKFFQRADQEMHMPSIKPRLSFDYTGDAYPGEQPERSENLYWHDEPSYQPETSEYQFFWGGGQLHVSPTHDHQELQGHAGIEDDHSGPIAMGHVSVEHGRATWAIRSNINANAVSRILKDYGKQVGWDWGGMTTIEGEPVGSGSEFAPTKSFVYAYSEGHLFIFATGAAINRTASIEGRILVTGDRAYVTYINRRNARALLEWAEDSGLTLTAGHDNVIKRIEDLEEHNLYSPEMNQEDRQFFPDSTEDDATTTRQPGGVFKCPNCSKIYPSWHLYMVHRRDEDAFITKPDEKGSGGFPESDMDAVIPTHFTDQQPRIDAVAAIHPTSVHEAQRVDGFDTYAKVWGIDKPEFHHYVAYRDGSPVGYASIKGNDLMIVQSSVQGEGIGTALVHRIQKHYGEINANVGTLMGKALLKRTGFTKLGPQHWKWSASTEPKDLIPGPLPFIYDIQEDKISVGYPGTRTSDIPGEFTPGGIVEGTYEPGGKIMIHTMTNMPYTTRYMLELWYHTQPALEVTSVSLIDAEGKKTKLAGFDIGAYVKALVASDPAAETAYNALRAAGGQVLVVGGAVRDALLGKQPHDVDLMVTGIPGKQVEEILEKLPGRMDITGKDFGVFRYKNGHAEVEIALPRREKSTGGGNKDFDVNADHTLSPEEDLYRRDFTANAMAIDLDTGHLIDPYGGQKDVADRRLRTLNPNSLAEDPLRVLRALTARSKHGLTPDDDTMEQMRHNAAGLHLLPRVRLGGELEKIMEGAEPHEAMNLAHESGVLQHFLPEVARAMGHDQNNKHHELDLGSHLLSVLKHAKQIRPDDKDFALMALLHDIGKIDSHWTECHSCGHNVHGPYKNCPECGSSDTAGHFYELEPGIGKQHETVGAEQANARLKSFNHFPQARIDRITHLVQNHMFPGFASAKGARKFMNNVGPEHADDLLDFRWADQGGKSDYPNPSGMKAGLSVDDQRRLVQQTRELNQPTHRSQLAINGGDLIAAGIKPSPQMGPLLERLTQEVLEDPFLNTKQGLIQRALEIHNEAG